MFLEIKNTNVAKEVFKSVVYSYDMIIALSVTLFFVYIFHYFPPSKSFDFMPFNLIFLAAVAIPMLQLDKEFSFLIQKSDSLVATFLNLKHNGMYNMMMNITVGSVTFNCFLIVVTLITSGFSEFIMGNKSPGVVQIAMLSMTASHGLASLFSIKYNNLKIDTKEINLNYKTDLSQVSPKDIFDYCCKNGWEEVDYFTRHGSSMIIIAPKDSVDSIEEVYLTTERSNMSPSHIALSNRNKKNALLKIACHEGRSYYETLLRVVGLIK
jgi:hypothetical protein